MTSEDAGALPRNFRRHQEDMSAAGGPRPEGLSRLAHVVLDVFDGPEARPEFEPTPDADEDHPSVLRFRGLDLD